MAQLLAERAILYLKGRDPHSQVTTASVIVQRLLDHIGAADAAKAKLSKRLVPMFAHRMLGDIHHFNDTKS